MTTHYVDIRLKSAGVAAPWEALTHDPIPFKDAKGLLAHIGDKWESRIRSAVTVEDLPTVLERLDLVTDVPPSLIVRAKDGKVDEATVAEILRSGVFSVFERYRGELGLERWRPTNNVPKHKRGCKRPRVSAEVIPQSTGAADNPIAEHWKILTELDARVAHVNSITLPGLGIVAAMTMDKPKLHTATCKSCGAVSHATSIALKVTWRNHHLGREYEI